MGETERAWRGGGVGGVMDEVGRGKEEEFRMGVLLGQWLVVSPSWGRRQ